MPNLAIVIAFIATMCTYAIFWNPTQAQLSVMSATVGCTFFLDRVIFFFFVLDLYLQTFILWPSASSALLPRRRFLKPLPVVSAQLGTEIRRVLLTATSDSLYQSE